MVGDVSPDIHFKNIPTTASGPVAGGHTDCHWTWPGHTDGRQNQTFHPSGGGDCARCGRCIGGGAVAGKNHAWPDYSTGIRVGEPRSSAFHSWRFRLWRRYGYLLERFHKPCSHRPVAGSPPSSFSRGEDGTPGLLLSDQRSRRPIQSSCALTLWIFESCSLRRATTVSIPFLSSLIAAFCSCISRACSSTLRCSLRNSLSNIAFTASYRTVYGLPWSSRATRSGFTFS